MYLPLLLRLLQWAEECINNIHTIYTKAVSFKEAAFLLYGLTIVGIWVIILYIIKLKE